jgi:hypothetical protein
VIAVAVGAFAAPNADGSSTVILSSIGLLAIVVGFATWPGAAYRAGWRRAFSAFGIALGAIALASTALTLANSTWQTAFPTLHDATRAALQPQATQVSVPIDIFRDPEPVPIVDIRITSAEEERAYLTDVLMRASALIGPSMGGESLPEIVMSTDSYPYTTAEGIVAIGSVEHFQLYYSPSPAGGYLLTLTGRAFGTIAQLDSTTGGIAYG